MDEAEITDFLDVSPSSAETRKNEKIAHIKSQFTEGQRSGQPPIASQARSSQGFFESHRMKTAKPDKVIQYSLADIDFRKASLQFIKLKEKSQSSKFVYLKLERI